METIDQAWGAVTEEEIEEAQRRAAEALLIPAGSYEGVILEWEKKEVKAESNPLLGKTVAHCKIELYDVEGKTRPVYADMTREIIETPSGRYKIETERALQLVAAMEMIGKPFSEVLDAAKDRRALYTIRVMPKREGMDAPRSFVGAIGKVQEGAF